MHPPRPSLKTIWLFDGTALAVLGLLVLQQRPPPANCAIAVDSFDRVAPGFASLAPRPTLGAACVRLLIAD